jgi:hypothetical protein
MDNKIFETATKITKPLSIISTVVIVLYLIYKAIIEAGIFSTLKENSTLTVVTSIIDKLFYLALAALVLGLATFVITQYINFAEKKLEGEIKRDDTDRINIIGNVFTKEGKPVKGAYVFVDGVDRRKETDLNGLFSIEVNPQDTWTVRASYNDKITYRTIRRDEIRTPAKLEFDCEFADISDTQQTENSVALAKQIQDFKSMLYGSDTNRSHKLNAQFDAYCGVWYTLQDMKTSANNLWQKPTEERIYQFAQQQQITEAKVNDSAIFFAERDYDELTELLHTFGSFYFGKEQLLEIRSRRQMQDSKEELGPVDTEESIRRQIKENAQLKRKYEKLLDKIRISFRDQLAPVETTTR